MELTLRTSHSPEVCLVECIESRRGSKLPPPPANASSEVLSKLELTSKERKLLENGAVTRLTMQKEITRHTHVHMTQKDESLDYRL